MFAVVNELFDLVGFSLAAARTVGERRTTLPKELHTARPRRLRFLAFNQAAEIIRHARSLIVRVGAPVRGLQVLLCDVPLALADRPDLGDLTTPQCQNTQPNHNSLSDLNLCDE